MWIDLGEGYGLIGGGKGSLKRKPAKIDKALAVLLHTIVLAIS